MFDANKHTHTHTHTHVGRNKQALTKALSAGSYKGAECLILVTWTVKQDKPCSTPINTHTHTHTHT